LERTLNPFSEFKRIRIRILHLTSLDLQVIAMPCDVEPVIVKIAHAAAFDANLQQLASSKVILLQYDKVID
jgi:hypothetical protein